jgi:FkbM family methyltransferase
MRRRVLDLIRIRARRALEMARADGRPGLRRELLTMDYVLPLRRRLSGRGPLALRTRSKAAAGTLYFGRDSFAVDRVAYFGIFLQGWYRADYRGALVVDLGAHKGYYGAFALHEGAQEVRSYEPEATNLAALRRAAASFGGRWKVENAAVSDEAGEVLLHVNVESAGHSIVQAQAAGERRPTLRSESVPVVAMREVLEAAPEGRPLIVKIDTEGAECDIVLGTPVELWRRVDHVFLEVHDFAPCSTDAIVDHLRQAGLDVVLREVDAEAEAELVALRR